MNCFRTKLYASAGFIVLALSGCQQDIKPICTEERSLRAANYDLEIKLKLALDQLKQAENRCKYTFEANALKAEKNQREQQQEALEQQKQRQARDLVNATRQGKLSLTQWNELLIGRPKAHLVVLIGQPQKVRKPRSSSDFGMEVWVYSSKVSMEESNLTKRDLYVFISKDEVTKIEAGL